MAPVWPGHEATYLLGHIKLWCIVLCKPQLLRVKWRSKSGVMFQAVQKSKTLKYSENEIYQYYLGDKAVGKNSIGGSPGQ